MPRVLQARRRRRSQRRNYACNEVSDFPVVDSTTRSTYWIVVIWISNLLYLQTFKNSPSAAR